MPLVRVFLRAGKSDDYKRAIGEGIYEALRATFNVPDDDRFIVVSDHNEADFQFSKTYMDIARSDDLVMIQITVSNTRNVTQKQALYEAIVDRLANAPGLRREDVFINLVEVVKENWSFGNGVAQYV